MFFIDINVVLCDLGPRQYPLLFFVRKSAVTTKWWRIGNAFMAEKKRKCIRSFRFSVPLRW